MWITPYHQKRDFKWPITIDDKIIIFSERTLGWQLYIARDCLTRIENSEFAVLAVVMSYFEMIAKYRDGYSQNEKSRQYFKKGILHVFSELINTKVVSNNVADIITNILYVECRCGLYHSNFTNPSIIINATNNRAMLFDDKKKQLFINIRILVEIIIDNFNSYITELRNTANKELRRNFEKRFDYDGSTHI